MKRKSTYKLLFKTAILIKLIGISFLLPHTTNAQIGSSPGSIGQTGYWAFGLLSTSPVDISTGYILKMPPVWVGSAGTGFGNTYTFPYGTYNTEYVYLYSLYFAPTLGAFTILNDTDPILGTTNYYNFNYNPFPQNRHIAFVDKFQVQLQTPSVSPQLCALQITTYLSHNANTSPISICEGSSFTSTLTDVHPGVYQLKDMATGTILSAPVTITADAATLTLISYPITASLFTGGVLPTSIQNFATYNGSSYDAAPSFRKVYPDTIYFNNSAPLVAVNLVQPISITPNLSNIAVGATSNYICPNSTATIAMPSSQAGKYYVLEDNTTGSRLNAPTLATGGALNMTTTPLSTNTTIRVKALQELRHLRFDGVNDYLATPTTALGLNGTWEAWVQKTNWADHHDDRLISNGINFPNNGSFYVSLHPVVGFHFRYGGQGQTGNNYVSTLVTQGFAANSWHHLAATWSNIAGTTTLKLYIDGALAATTTSTLTLGNSANIKLGGTGINGDNTYFGNGSMYDIRLWNTAKTATEIASNYFKVLSGIETGLIANYKFNETSGTTAADASPNNNTATLTNFTLPAAWGASSTCNGSSFVMSQTQNIEVDAEAAAIAKSNIIQSLNVSATPILFSNGCSNLITKITPNGTSPISGNTTTKVWIDATQNAQFVKRHYEITPAANATTATARIKLYFTQQEFDDFNAVNTIKLPTSSSDVASIANLLIEKRGGTSSNNSGNLNTYTGSIETINPNDADIIWKSNANRWEVSFDVTGFSGFFVKTAATILPVTWLSVNANLNNKKQALINWQVQENNVSNYVLEKSIDGRTFVTIATLLSNGNGTNNYSYTDAQSINGIAYYRIKQIDLDNRFSCSSIVKLYNTLNGDITIYSNPVKNQFVINIPHDLINEIASIYAIDGKKIKEIKLNSISNTVNIENLVIGIYFIHFNNGKVEKIIKE